MQSKARMTGPHAAFGERLRSARRRAGLSHDVLGDRAGTSRQHLIKLEQGWHKPKPPMMAGLAVGLGVTVEWLEHGDANGSAASEETDSEAAEAVGLLSLDELLRLRIQEIVTETLRVTA